MNTIWALIEKTTDFSNRKAVLKTLCRQVGAQFASEIDSDNSSPIKTGIPAVDCLSGGLPRNTISEVVESAPSSGGNVLLHRLLKEVREQRGYVAIVDGNDSFAPDSVEEPETLRHLYLVRCRDTKMAMQVSDLLAGDGNFSMLLIDLRRNELEALHRIPGNRWYRLQRTVHKGACTCIVFTAKTMVPAAKLRFRLVAPFDLSALDQGQTFLCEQISAETLNEVQQEQIV